jgi:FkbH-like protein
MNSTEEKRVRVSVLSSFLTDYLVDMLRLMLVRRGIAADFNVAAYGQMLNEILTHGPALARTPEVVLVLPSYRDLRCVPLLGCTAEQAQAAAAEEAEFWSSMIRKIEFPIVMLSFYPPRHRVLSDGDGFVPGGLTHHVRRVNLALAESLPGRAALVDGDSLFAQLGLAGHDSRLYAICKQPFAMEALPTVADALAAGIAGQLGRSKKVLVLDLDNTLWGGVVGDAGVDGIILGPETPEGEAFLGFQKYVQALARRGVILAVCSKNHDHVARAAFRDHQAMLLKESDIACFVANFEDKATNIRRISETLNVGLDSLVFVDDNPVERTWVKRELPEVTVVDLPDEPAGYADAVDSANLFPLFRLTQEDLTRKESYKTIATMKLSALATGDIEAFLRDLAPQAYIEHVGSGTVDRIVQLIRKTNQFKLNPTTFTHEEVRESAHEVIALRLVDRLQDYGIVAIAITCSHGDALIVRNWVMSCRVFSRRLEHLMCALIMQRARASGADQVIVPFVASAKNGIVPEILSGLGFHKNEQSGDFRAAPNSMSDATAHYMQVYDQRSSDISSEATASA